MSYQIGMDLIHLRPTPRWGHTEYCSCAALRRAVEAQAVAAGQPGRFEDLWELDLMWSTNDGPVYWGQRGRVTDMGHADFLEGGTDRRMPKVSPFADAQDVWAFDAVKEYGLPDFAELVSYYTQWHQEQQTRWSNQVFSGGYYKTIISGAIDAFGWDNLLLAAADQERFERVLDSIYRLARHHFQAWAQTPAPVFICHDDFVWSEGPFLHPGFYRRVIIPRYASLWKLLHDAGKKVLFCSDGNWIEFIDDIAAAGADGFIFEPMMPLEPVVERYGQTHAIFSSKVDCRTLTFGTPEKIAAELAATKLLAQRCRGFFYAVGNHIPSNVPVDNGLFYMDRLRQTWAREHQCAPSRVGGHSARR